MVSKGHFKGFERGFVKELVLMKNEQAALISSRIVYDLWLTLFPDERKDFLNNRVKEPRLKAIVKQFGKIDDPIKLWQKVFGKSKPFNSGTLRVYLSKIKTALEEYLILQEAGPQTVAGKLHLARLLEDRGKFPQAQAYSQNVQKALEASSNRDLTYSKHQFEAELITFRTTSSGVANDVKQVEDIRQQHQRKLLLELVQQAFLLKSKQMVVLSEKSSGWEFALLGVMRKLDEMKTMIAHDTVASAYLFLLETMDQDEWEVAEAQERIDQVWEQLDDGTRYVFVVLIYNYLIRKVNQDTGASSSHELKQFIYKWHVRGVLSEKDRAWPIMVNWLIRLGCVTNGAKEGRAILNACVRLYPGSISMWQEEYLSLLLLFFEEKYEVFLNKVQVMSLTDKPIAVQANIRFWEILVCVRLGDEEAYIRKVDTYRHWLREEKSVKTGQVEQARKRLSLLRAMWLFLKKNQVKEAKIELENSGLSFVYKGIIKEIFLPTQTEELAS